MIYSVFDSSGSLKMNFSGNRKNLELNLQEGDQVVEGHYDKDHKLLDGKPVYSPEPIIPPTNEEIKERLRLKRQKAYNREADPLFFKWQAGEITKEEWVAKRQEIKAKNPYPTAE